MNPIRVLTVDDHLVVRQGIRMIAGTDKTIQIVGEAKDGQSAFHQVKELRPDVVLMDLVMPNENGIEAMVRIKRDQPQIKVVVLTTFEDEDKIRAAMAAGADGFLLKDADGDALHKAIHTAYRGEMPLHPRIARHLFKKNASSPDSTLNTIDDLTERERDVLEFVVKGLSNKEVARALSISEGTVKIHVSNILGKLHLANRTQAALYGLREGLTDLNPE